MNFVIVWNVVRFVVGEPTVSFVKRWDEKISWPKEELYMNDNVEKFEVKMDEKGNLIINPYEYLENLSDEKKNEFLWDGGWWCLVESHIVESIIKSFGTENYNE
jgi:hypothetical protein